MTESERSGGTHVDVDRSNGIQIGDRNIQFNAGMLAVVAATVVAVGGTVIGYRALAGGPEPTAAPEPLPSAAGTSAAPAPKDAPPVLVRGVTKMRSNSGDGSFVTAEAIRLDDAVLDRLDSDAFSDAHQGTSVDFGRASLTLQGNARGTVRITNMLVHKQCSAPLTGTYFQGYSQGGPDTLRIGFDLDAADPVAKELGFSAAEGLFQTRANFFDGRTITLAPGETEEVVIGAYSKHSFCTFTVRLIISTAAGLLYQDVDENGAPFRVSATAPPRVAGQKLSGYTVAYAYTSPGGWRPAP